MKTYAKSVKKRKIDMTLSTNPLGCSFSGLKTIKKITSEDLVSYPNDTSLINKLSKKFRANPKNIIFGTGSEQLIKLIAQTFNKNSQLVMVQSCSFGLFYQESLLTGAKVVSLQTKKLQNIKPRLLFLASPNNPTGEIISKNEINFIRKQLPQTIIVIDEANVDFLDESLFDELGLQSNFIFLRTFSKAFGLAGLRIGFALGPAGLISKLNQNQQAFPVSSVALRVAEAIMDDQKFINKTKKFIEQEKNFLIGKLQELNFETSNSKSINIFIKSKNADEIIKKLEKQNVSVIPSSFFPFSNKKGFRISIKDRNTNRQFIKKLKQIVLHHSFPHA